MPLSPPVEPKPGSALRRVLRRARDGIALNVDMDLEPFGRINPCGYAGLPVTDLARSGAHPAPELQSVARDFGQRLADHIERP